jgi:hypothetical protein
MHNKSKTPTLLKVEISALKMLALSTTVYGKYSLILGKSILNIAPVYVVTTVKIPVRIGLLKNAP